MTEKTRKENKARLCRAISRQLLNERWAWRAGSFVTYYYQTLVKNGSVLVQFVARMATLKVRIESEEPFAIPDSVHMFIGDNAVTDCIFWTVEKLLDLYEILCKRTEPYAAATQQYEHALRGRFCKT